MKTAEEAGKDLIVQINQDLIAARHAYYALAAPIMTDSQYDSTERNLSEMVVAMPQFKKLATVLYTVGSDVTHSSGRIRHATPMLSLENKYDFDELRNWCQRFPDQQFVLEPKVDGASAALLYLDRKLVKAVTRGDGQFGEDVTKQMAASGAIPLSLPIEFFPDTPVEIRGEVFITTGQFDDLNAELEAAGEKPYMSPRNLAAGSMKLLDLEAVKHRGLRLFVWQVDGLSAEYLTKRSLDIRFAHHAISYVTKILPVFRQSIFSTANNAEDLIKLIDTSIRKEREAVWHKGLGMQTDGVVIKLMDPAARKEAGVGSKVVNWGCSWKYPSEKKGTVLRDVIWQTGKTGSMTPVGVLDPINVGGAIVQRVNLNNWSFIQDLAIELGDEVLLHRGGEVIPVCTGVSKKAVTPIAIPEPLQCVCGATLTKSTNPKSGVTTHWCESDECTEQLKARLEYIANRTVLEIDELGPELIEKLVSKQYVLSLSDLFAFANDVTNMNYTQSASVLKMTKSVHAAKTRDWDKWLAALDLPNIGRTLGKVLAMQLRLQSEDLPQIRTLLTTLLSEHKIEGIGEIRKTEVVEYFAKHGEHFDAEVKALYDAGVRPTPLIQAETSGGAQPLSGYVICITGEFDHLGERDYLSQCLTTLGASMKTGVSKKLNLLLVGMGAGRSKTSKAAELGIPTEGRDWLTKIFTDNNIATKSKMSTFDVEDDFL